jgi:hypothetical protein
MRALDYATEAQLAGCGPDCSPGRARISGGGLGYKRIARATDAICFAMEELPLDASLALILR